MKTPLLPHPVLTPTLAVFWVLLVNAVTPASILLGLLLGWLIPLFTLRFWPDRVVVHRPWLLVRLILRLLGDIVVENLRVSYLVLRGPEPLRPAYVTMPLALRSDLGISLLANIISLTPGSLSAWLSPDCSHLVIHVLDIDESEALLATIRARYEMPLREILEPC